MFKQYGMKQLGNPVVRVRNLRNCCECLRLFELVDRTELIRLQQCGPGLSLFELADKGDDHYLIKSGVLRTCPDVGSARE